MHILRIALRRTGQRHVSGLSRDEGNIIVLPSGLARGWRHAVQPQCKRLLLLGLLTASFCVPSRAALVNGDFSAGLVGWSAAGNVQPMAGTAAFGDGEDGSGAALYQIVSLTPGQYCFSFDFRNGLSDSVPTGAFPDSFFVSLYFVDDPGDFDLSDNLPAQAVLGLDYSGVLTGQGILSASLLGTDWTHLDFLFTNSFAYVTPYFELFDLNFIGSDSGVWVDNVCFRPVETVVPEPPSHLLAAFGLMILFGCQFAFSRVPGRCVSGRRLRAD